MTLRWEGTDAADRAERATENLDEAEFDLGPDLVVDIAVADRSRKADGVEITLEALTIEAD